ncbi:zinc transport system ATP-binding protein [Nocardiopsis sp. Huas11]|uniref:metal ABC transporter ATP-binding protein n=1 Tax=Nocardiopsis sp. Huas11 TaxID=2183912 RepID=UPI000F1BB5FF|nr:metal ABC transporter ATP-binding protein [Nocardiopsis sp. Huas11]RKS10087.1 zinc transport system ATP-binding protein [Nocardiopsis sp. Huas11]
MSDQFTGTAVGDPDVPPAFRITDAVMGYDGTPVLDGVDLDVPVGQTMAVMGPNGSGKSTLMRAMLGLTPLSAGRILIHGTPLRRFRDWRRIGYVPQRLTAGGAVPATVREIVASGQVASRRLLSLPTRSDRAAIDEALETVGLTDRARDSVRELSGGQQQRVLIARALAGRPDTFVMDEPMAGVDAENQRELARTIDHLRGTGATVVLVLHELGPLEDVIERAVVLDGGRIAHDGRRAPEATGPCARPGHEHQHPHPDPNDPDPRAAGADPAPADLIRLEVPGSD